MFLKIKNAQRIFVYVGYIHQYSLMLKIEPESFKLC